MTDVPSMTTIKVRPATREALKSYMEECGAPTQDAALQRALFAARCTLAFDSMDDDELSAYRDEAADYDADGDVSTDGAA